MMAEWEGGAAARRQRGPVGGFKRREQEGLEGGRRPLSSRGKRSILKLSPENEGN